MKLLPKSGAIEMLTPNSMTTISTKSWLICVGARRPPSRKSLTAGSTEQPWTTEGRERFMKKMQNDPDMLDEYDFSGGVRGKYAKRYAEGTNVVVLDPDVAEYFSDHESVNESLRSLVAIIKKHGKAEQAAVD